MACLKIQLYNENKGLIDYYARTEACAHASFEELRWLAKTTYNEALIDFDAEADGDFKRYASGRILADIKEYIRSNGQCVFTEEKYDSAYMNKYYDTGTECVTAELRRIKKRKKKHIV